MTLVSSIDADAATPGAARAGSGTAAMGAVALAALTAVCTGQTRIDTPLGGLLLARSAAGLVGVWFDGQRWHPGSLAAPWSANDPLLGEAARQLAGYFAGVCRSFDLPLDPRGTPFQCAVWQRLGTIERGCTTTYGAIARKIGTPRAVRAVGAAIGRNPLSVVVPCHRVLGAGGAPTGYAGGLRRKAALLALEGAG